MKIEINVKKGVKADKVRVKKIAQAILKALGLKKIELSVLITDDLGIRELNKTFRNIDAPTDCLSFPSGEEPPFYKGGLGGIDAGALGDIAISIDKAASQAKEFKVSLEGEMKRLLTHSVLHLMGFDHVKGGRQARLMKEKEEAVLKALPSLRGRL
ncbi:MAG: rRNA maturation RNase YbeY [Deltaproteobacteria bacterium]